MNESMPREVNPANQDQAGAVPLNNTATNNGNRRNASEILLAGVNNDAIIIIFVLIMLFFINIFYIVKNQILLTATNIVRRVWVKLFNLEEYQRQLQEQNTDKGIDDTTQETPVLKKNNKFNINICSICLHDIQYEVSASCFHLFCGRCIMEYWTTNNRTMLKCPICRRVISMLYINYDVNSSDEPSREITRNIFHYNYLFSKQDRTIFQIIIDTPFLVLRTLKFLSTTEGLRFIYRKIVSNFYLLFLIIYVLSPLDIIPECFFGVIGILDDLIAMSLIFLILSNIYYQHLSRRDTINHLQRAAEGDVTINTANRAGDEITSSNTTINNNEGNNQAIIENTNS